MVLLFILKTTNRSPVAYPVLHALKYQSPSRSQSVLSCRKDAASSESSPWIHVRQKVASGGSLDFGVLRPFSSFLIGNVLRTGRNPSLSRHCSYSCTRASLSGCDFESQC